MHILYFRYSSSHFFELQQILSRLQRSDTLRSSLQQFWEMSSHTLMKKTSRQATLYTYLINVFIVAICRWCKCNVNVIEFYKKNSPSTWQDRSIISLWMLEYEQGQAAFWLVYYDFKQQNSRLLEYLIDWYVNTLCFSFSLGVIAQWEIFPFCSCTIKLVLCS